MIEHLTGVLTEERVDVLHQTQIGCEVSSCEHTYPHLLLLPMSGNLSVITLIYTFIYLVLILCFMSINEYNILPFICFEIMYILRINKIWLQMLLCMPEPFVCDYRPLVSEPKLMLEQLLMNMKVWVPAVQKTSMTCLFSLNKQIRVGIYLFSDSLSYFFFVNQPK